MPEWTAIRNNIQIETISLWVVIVLSLGRWTFFTSQPQQSTSSCQMGSIASKSTEGEFSFLIFFFFFLTDNYELRICGRRFSIRFVICHLSSCSWALLGFLKLSNRVIFWVTTIVLYKIDWDFISLYTLFVLCRPIRLMNNDVLNYFSKILILVLHCYLNRCLQFISAYKTFKKKLLFKFPKKFK